MPITSVAAPNDISNFLQLRYRFDENSRPSREIVENYIRQAQAIIEKRTGTAYEPKWVSDEVHDVQSWRSQHYDFGQTYLTGFRPVALLNRPVLPFSSSRGHKIEVYEGSDTTPSASDPIPRWTDWLATKTEGRDADWWCDYDRGFLFIRKPIFSRRNALFRITYEYGQPITQLNGALSSSATTITVDSTYRYAARGIIRIDDEFCFYTGKTTTTLTGVTRGALDSTAVAHSDNAEVFWVPENVRHWVIKLASAMYLENQRFVAAVPSGEAVDVTGQAREWRKEVYDETGGMTWRLA